jgi:pyruvate ferredoxin oxidoreductase delta subunit
MTEKKKPIDVNEAAVIRRPGSSRENKTGSWRTFRPVVTAQCSSCGICGWYCPEQAIKQVQKGGKRKTVIDYDYCKGCLICVNECPTKAMKAEKEE